MSPGVAVGIGGWVYLIRHHIGFVLDTDWTPRPPFFRPMLSYAYLLAKIFLYIGLYIGRENGYFRALCFSGMAQNAR